MGHCHNRRKGLMFPKQKTEEIAEIVGAMFGDGMLSNPAERRYRIDLCGNLESDLGYFIHLGGKIKNSFGVDSKIIWYPEKNSFTLYIFSKTLCEFFNEKLKIPYSPKKNLTIPDWILRKKRFFVSFARGLFDTDGCVVFQTCFGKYTYPLVKISCEKNLAVSIKENLFKIGINSFICSKKNENSCCDLVVKKDILKWIKTIGSNNLRNIKKLNLVER